MLSTTATSLREPPYKANTTWHGALETARLKLLFMKYANDAQQILGKYWMAWIIAYVALCAVSLALTVAVIKTTV